MLRTNGRYAAQQLEDEKLRTSLLQSGTLAQLKVSKDPFLQAAQRIWPAVSFQLTLNGVYVQLRPAQQTR